MKTFLLSMITFCLYMILKYRKSYYALQQNFYHNKPYLKWSFKSISKTYLTYEIVLLVLFIILNYFIEKEVILILILYFIAFVFEIYKVKKEQHKKKFVFTKRIFRMTCATLVLFSLLLFMILHNYTDNIFNYLYIFLFGYLSFIITCIVNIINIPLEKLVYLYYKRKAVNKLNSIPNLKIVGITGSYGKTTSKNILNEMLKTSFNCYATPKSYNTAYGLMNSINNGLDKFDEVFIAEMGTLKKGDIRKLAKLVKPKYGILTTIGVAHLESFKKEENIQKEKFDLIVNLPSDGIGILNMDDPKQVNYKIQNKCKLVWISIDNKDADFIATDIKLSSKGTSFKVKIDGKNYEFNTILLGKHNIYNILAGIALSYNLGVDIEKIIYAVSKLKPVEHRLELKKYNDITIIDDAFNSNPVGSKMALDVLSYMDGTKVIVTPGMIELGPKEYEYNFKFGEYISKVCDQVILIGEKQTKPIYEGLISNNYDKNNIHILNDVKDAFKLINELKADYVLLENDLPDIFSEV